MADKGKKEKKDTFIDFGLGGLFKGIGNVIDLVSEMVEEGEEEVAQTGEFKVKGLGDKAKGVYGLHVRMGLGGIPTVEHFGNIRATEEGPVVAEEREPLVDVFDEGDVILVVAELPGVEKRDIHIEVKDDVLSLSTVEGRKYAKEILLPSLVDPATMETAYRNGVLEVRLAKQQVASR
ncbi:MAG: archaeal heat shock protein Hsp20 [Chloroflexota bacterium]